jgi:hypothetical protein
MSKKIRIISLVIGLILIVVGCSGQMTEEKYIDFVNASLEDMYSNLLILESALEEDDHWLIKEDAEKFKESSTRILKSYENISPPNKFKYEHTILLDMFKSLEECSINLVIWSETGDENSMRKTRRAIRSVEDSYRMSVFSKNYVKKQE